MGATKTMVAKPNNKTNPSNKLPKRKTRVAVVAKTLTMTSPSNPMVSLNYHPLGKQ
jgi:hypothetical protein